MNNYYASMLADLERRRDALLAELQGLITAISVIGPLASGESPAAPSGDNRPWTASYMPPQPSDVPNSQPRQVQVPDRYQRISVRWAALWHLAEFAEGPMRNGEIADAILAGGYQTSAGSFPNACSAVLYQMRERGEVEGSSDAGYWLTPKGKQTWMLIKQGSKFREATSPASNEQTLLSVQ